MFKEIGTLAEIGAKAGDVVECVGSCYGPSKTTLSEYDMYRFERCDYRIVSRASDLSKLDYKTINVEKPIYEIAPEARPLDHFQSGPVITETVTRKRIVPGVYGKVSIGFDGPNGDVLLVDLTQGLLTEDLTAAIETLTAIRDAMENNA